MVILHIEDNFDNRVLVRRLLQSASYKVVEAENAFQAVRLLSKYSPSLILMDINLPGIDGYSFTAKLRTISKMAKTPIIAITANAMRGDREKALRAGCDGYIEKPIDIDNFLIQIDKYLTNSGKRIP